ncbi:MAG: (2Fe-2S) ferredoxin domain-containing protein [Chloroflexi bacterium]|nr:(2Fe-2S) ferredoxin domain-containing protein [Chloroflexota bacterium]
MKSLEALRSLRERVDKDISTRRDTGTTIIVGMGTCGIAAGARDTMHAIMEEIRKRDIEAHITTVGCIGMCAREPLVDIVQAGKPRVTYGNVTPDMVPRLIDEHLKKGQVVEEWVVGRLQDA